MSEFELAAYQRYAQHDAAKTPQESPYYLPDGFIKFDGDAFERDCQVLAAMFHEQRKAATQNREATEELHCGHCDKETPHTVYDAGHERDSTHDWQRCNVCGWQALGMSGEYEPPVEA